MHLPGLVEMGLKTKKQTRHRLLRLSTGMSMCMYTYTHIRGIVCFRTPALEVGLKGNQEENHHFEGPHVYTQAHPQSHMYVHVCACAQHTPYEQPAGRPFASNRHCLCGIRRRHPGEHAARPTAHCLALQNRTSVMAAARPDQRENHSVKTSPIKPGSDMFRKPLTRLLRRSGTGRFPDKKNMINEGNVFWQACH